MATARTDSLSSSSSSSLSLSSPSDSSSGASCTGWMFGNVSLSLLTGAPSSHSKTGHSSSSKSGAYYAVASACTLPMMCCGIDSSVYSTNDVLWH